MRDDGSDEASGEASSMVCLVVTLYTLSLHSITDTLHSSYSHCIASLLSTIHDEQVSNGHVFACSKMFVCICLWVFWYVWALFDTFVRVFTRLCVLLLVCACFCSFVRAFARLCVFLHVCACFCTFVRVFARLYVFLHVYACFCTFARVLIRLCVF